MCAPLPRAVAARNKLQRGRPRHRVGGDPEHERAEGRLPEREDPVPRHLRAPPAAALREVALVPEVAEVEVHEPAFLRSRYELLVNFEESAPRCIENDFTTQLLFGCFFSQD